LVAGISFKNIYIITTFPVQREAVGQRLDLS